MWVAIGLALAVLRRRPDILALTVGADVVAQLTSLALRIAIGRDRPPVDFPEPEPLVQVPEEPSLPSGHSASSFACAAILASVAPRLAVPLFLLAAAIAASRVYVGVHYPLDVIAGAALGIALATALRRLEGGHPRLRRSSRRG